MLYVIAVHAADNLVVMFAGAKQLAQFGEVLMILDHKSLPLISRSFKFQNHDRRLYAFVAQGASDG